MWRVPPLAPWRWGASAASCSADPRSVSRPASSKVIPAATPAANTTTPYAREASKPTRTEAPTSNPNATATRKASVSVLKGTRITNRENDLGRRSSAPRPLALVTSDLRLPKIGDGNNHETACSGLIVPRRSAFGIAPFDHPTIARLAILAKDVAADRSRAECLHGPDGRRVMGRRELSRKGPRLGRNSLSEHPMNPSIFGLLEPDSGPRDAIMIRVSGVWSPFSASPRRRPVHRSEADRLLFRRSSPEGPSSSTHRSGCRSGSDARRDRATRR